MRVEVHQDKLTTLNVVYRFNGGFGRWKIIWQRKNSEYDSVYFDIVFRWFKIRKDSKISVGRNPRLHKSENYRKYNHIVLLLWENFKGEILLGFNFVAASAKTKYGLCIVPWVRRAMILEERRHLIRVENRGEKIFFEELGIGFSR